MKRLFLTLTLLFIVFNIQSQDFNSQIGTFESNLKTVKSNKKEFNQTVEIIQDGVIKITIEEVDNKGKTALKVFEFNTSDISKGSVKKVVKKDIVFLQMKTKNKQKLIKQTTNSEKVSYVDNIKIYAEDITNARELISSFTESIPIAKMITDNRLNLSTYNEYLNWLNNNISEVGLTKTEITQSFKENSEFIGSVTYDKTSATEKATEKESFVFNLLTLNPKAITYKVSGEGFNISIETKKAKKVIKYFENGEQTKFINKFLIACKDVEQARDLRKVLKNIIPLAKKQFTNSIKSITNINDGLAQINTVIGSFGVNNSTVKQAIKGDCIVDFDLSIDADKSENHHYNFSFSDIDSNKINYTSKGNFLIVNLFTKGGEPFIKHVGDDEKSSYIKTIKLYTPSIEKIIILKKTLKGILKLCGGDDSNEEVSNNSDEPSSSNVAEKEEEEEEEESTVAANCKPNKSAKQANGDFVDLYGGRIRSGGFGSNDKSVYSLYIGQIDAGKKGTTVICVLNEPVDNKKEYNNAVNNFLNENNLKTSVLELTLNGKTLRIPATECKQKPTKFLGDINGYFVTFEGDILKDQLKMMQDYDLQRFRLIVGGHPYERYFKKPTKRTKDLKRFFNCVEMNNIFEVKKKDATKMDLSEVSAGDYANAINGKWVMQGTNGSVTEFNNGKVIYSKMGVKKNEGSYKIVGKRVIITTNNGNSISEISMFLKDMLILKEKGVEKTYERID